MYRGVVSIDTCYSQGEGLSTPLSRLSYLVMYTVLQLPHLSLYLVSVRHLVLYVLDAHDERYINYVCLCISGPYITLT